VLESQTAESGVFTADIESELAGREVSDLESNS